MKIVVEKVRLFRDLHPGTPGDAHLERFVCLRVPVVTVLSDTAADFDVDARVPGCFLHMADALSCALINDARPISFMGSKRTFFLHACKPPMNA